MTLDLRYEDSIKQRISPFELSFVELENINMIGNFSFP
jgi:hypothetical protein